MLALERDIGVPVGSMKKSTLVFLDAGNCGPLPVVENTAGIDKNIGKVADGVSRDIVANLEVVSVLLVVPESTNNLVLGLDVTLQAILVGKPIEVGEDLCCWGVYG